MSKTSCVHGALQNIKSMEHQGFLLSKDKVLKVLQECALQHHHAVARHAQSLMVRSELDSDSLLGNHLIRLFSLCGSLLEVNQAFCRISNPDVFSWNAIISAHIHMGEHEHAVKLFGKMQEEGIEPDRVLYLSSLKACGLSLNIEQGRQIHSKVIFHGFDVDVFVGSSIIDMYAKCCNLVDAKKTFDKLENRNKVSWHAMISGYVQNGVCLPAVELFKRMQEEGMKADSFVFSCILKACGLIKNVGFGRQLHNQIKGGHFETDMVVCNALVDMYCKCASLKEAREVFDKMPNPNIISWTAMIGGYAQLGYGAAALEVHDQMLSKGIFPERATFLCILKACNTFEGVELGRFIHSQIVCIGLDLDIAIANTVVDMYAKGGNLDDAQTVFDKLSDRNVVSWGAMIVGHCQNGNSLCSLNLFAQMQQDDVKPDDIMFASLLKACTNLEAVQQGKLIHDQILRGCLKSDVSVQNSLVDMYAKSGCLEEALKVFKLTRNRNLISWGSIIGGCTQQGNSIQALSLFDKMQEEGFVPDKAIWLSALHACGNIQSVQKGRAVHEQINDSNFRHDLVIGNALIDMYAKCGVLDEALKVFNELASRDVTSWGTILTGHSIQKSDLAVLILFERMQEEDIIEPNDVIFPCILKACSCLGSSRLGMLIHDQVLRCQLESITVLENSLVDMYTKNGSLEEACAVFDRMEKKDQASWSTLITGYTHSGNFTRILHCLEGMKQQGCKPNGPLFVNILGACSQAGTLEEARNFFKMMTDDFSLRPAVEHYNCIIDLLGRAGSLLEAVKFIETMPIPLDLVGWISMLTNCRVYGEVEIGRICFKQVMQLDPGNAPALMLMTSIYADAGMWGDSYRLQETQIDTQ